MINYLHFLMASGGDGGGGIMGAIIPLVIVIGIFYFLVIRPHRKEQKKHEEMVSNLENGDKVVTGGGIHGTIVGIGENKIQLRIADGVKIDVNKNSIAGKQAENA